MAIAPANIETPAYDPYMRPWAMRYARERVGLSLEEAAARITDWLTWPRCAKAEQGQITVTPEMVAAWEAGVAALEPRQRLALCKIYLYPYYGYRIEEPLDEPIKDFRSAPDGTAVDIDYETHLTLDQFDRFYEMTEEVAIGDDGEVLPNNVPYSGTKTTEQLAREIRATLGVNEVAQRSWGDASNSYNEWKRRIEGSGVFVFSLPLNVAQVRGASRWDRGCPPTILVSTLEDPAERILTLLHEYAHLMHRREPSARCDPNREHSANPTERRMNQVAAEVVMPQDRLRREAKIEFRQVPFHEWPASIMEDLTTSLGVSSEIMATRLADLGLAARNHHATPSSKNGQMPQVEPMTDPELYMGYLGEPMVKLLRAGAKRGGVTIGETAKLWIRIDTTHLDRILFDDAA